MNLRKPAEEGFTQHLGFSVTPCLRGEKANYGTIRDWNG
jgi:hypothetical protein